MERRCSSLACVDIHELITDTGVPLIPSGCTAAPNSEAIGVPNSCSRAHEAAAVSFMGALSPAAASRWIN